jgi:glycosyltransferase involved in cell wall biosynthesis
MKVKVLMTTEGTYPFHHGGVSTWCNTLINNLINDFDFYVFSIMMNPFVTQKFKLPKDAKLIKVPLWGTEEPSEHLDRAFSKVYLAKQRTNNKVIKEKFLPLFMIMIDEIISNNKDPVRFGHALSELYLFFQTYDYKISFKSELTWDAYKNYIMNIKTINKTLPTPGVYSIINSLGWLYRFMTILNTPIPKVDVSHSAAAAFCGIPCAIAKIQNNTPFLLTEHGVYLREQYLSLSKRGYPPFLSDFLIKMVHSIVGLNYYYADQVSSVCSYNTRWEKRLGVEKDRIQVIYNGVDNNIFYPEDTYKRNKQPTVVSVARIDPVKDIITLIKTAAKVKELIPDVKFIVYGSITVEEYYKECLQLKDSLSLGESFIFAGHTMDMAEAYKTGDVIALSSISEAFPYSIVEAMMSGKAIVATDVGGIKEALGDCGILVSPRNAEEFSKAIIKLLKNSELRSALSQAGRKRALNNFTIAKVNSSYRQSYNNLMLNLKQDYQNKDVLQLDVINKRQQKLLMEKGLALLELGIYEEALIQFRRAILEKPQSIAVPFILTKVAEVYKKLGKEDKARVELEKADLIYDLIKSCEIA